MKITGAAGCFFKWRDAAKKHLVSATIELQPQRRFTGSIQSIFDDSHLGSDLSDIPVLVCQNLDVAQHRHSTLSVLDEGLIRSSVCASLRKQCVLKGLSSLRLTPNALPEKTKTAAGERLVSLRPMVEASFSSVASSKS